MHGSVRSAQKGISLLEIIASMALVGVLVLAGYSFLFTAVDGFLFSTDNTRAVGELKPMLDYLTTRMSDMEEVDCFSANTALQFTDSNDQAVTVAIDAANSVVINNWKIVDDVNNVSFTLSPENSHVKIISLSFDYTLANGHQATYSMEFSPRRYIPSSEIAGCTS